MINMNESLCDIRLSHRLFVIFAKKSRVTLMSFWCATMVASYIRINFKKEKTEENEVEIVRVEHLVKTYGEGDVEVRAVDDVSFSVEKGEFLCIIGASGSGKSTLMHLIGGVDRPTSGSVYIDGEDIFKMKDDTLAVFRRRQVGIIYQFYNLLPVLTAYENITLPMDLDGQNVSKERVDEVINQLGLNGRENHLPNQLSGGQQQRVAIGRAIINNPAVILADELTGNLDKKASDEIIGLLKETNKKHGQTIIMITHDLEIAKQADRVLTMVDGKLK